MHTLMTKLSSNEFRHILFAPLVASVFYFAVGVFAFQFMDERNGVVGGTLLPNRDHWPAGNDMLAGHRATFLPPGFYYYMLVAVKASEHLGGSYFFWRLVQD